MNLLARMGIAGAVVGAALATAGVGQAIGSPHLGSIEVGAPVATAERIAVFVPGAGVTMDNAGRVGGPLEAANAVVAAARSEKLAAVAWVGYRTPNGIGVESATGTRARDGARELTAYLDRLAATTDAPITVFCHSYGSVVCGLARYPTDVTDVVAYASPGMRQPRAASLHPRVWVAAAQGDAITFTPHVRIGDLFHGVDPAGKAFGARLVDTGTAYGHDGYVAPGTESLANFARIALGHSAQVTTRPPH
ncbi:alpha/beta hydrolase [Tenggerimyces flavus]|uniref:Alpha/beta hydrolase n=1 Tax=Tenggerimyces flavus TaxID=1708749 RepID=A0ABV7YRN5_9ACTN|nr:alpha/beta hydrolase [Tenggerimyces flavus]MBM7786320.1 hypothetical protein [Tenggerimyces flavus]